MDHRRFLLDPDAQRPFVGTDVFERVGGHAAVEALVDGLYDRIEADPPLRRLFGKHLVNERQGQKRFFAEWLGGPSAYSERAYLTVAQRHHLLPITPGLAERWLTHFRASLDLAVSDAEARKKIYAQARRLALALVNDGETPAPIRAKSHGVCLRYAPAIESLTLASRGDTAGLDAILGFAPDVLVSHQHAAELLRAAVLAGRLATVQLLLDRGVDVNLPAAIQPLILITPLCAARARRRHEVESLLLARGAHEDIFTHAFLGDVVQLEADLARHPEWAQVADPAVDALAVTPVHHAVAGAQVESLRVLLTHVPSPIVNAARALRDAAAHGNVAIVRMLLERGVDASSLGAGRWVLDPELAPLLAKAGAAVDRSGGWMGLCCTGNRGRKDDPEYVAALLRYGARVDDRRLVGQDTDGGRATALHYAAKAGFTQTIGVLLDHGADPRARDDNGLTPLDWLERSAKSVNREAVRAALGCQCA